MPKISTSTRFHAGIDVRPVTPCSFCKNNLCIQKARVGVFLCVQSTSLGYFLLCPGNQRGNQVRISLQ